MRESLKQAQQTVADPPMSDAVRGAHLSWMKYKMEDMTSERYQKFEVLTQAITNA